MSGFDDVPRRRGDFPVLRAVPTRWHDNDHYGHVNNVVHYAWFDTVVNATLIERAEVDVRDLDAVGLVVETACRYLAPVSFPEQVDVGLAVARLGRSSVDYRLAVFAADRADPCALGRFVHVYVDRRAGGSVEVPEVVRRALEPLVLDGPDG